MKPSTFFRHLHPKYLWRNRSGRCTVCGRRSLFLLTLDAERIRNDAVCVRCGSVSRHRHMALCILEAFADRGVSGLAGFGARPDLRVFNTVSVGPMVRAMGRHPNIVCSEFFDGVPPGESKGGVLCQDLENLSFPDAQFDLVLSEDVFEHLKDWRKGFREVLRVLRTGGFHIFSIPFYFRSRSEDLFERRGGEWVPLGPVEYHGDPVRGEIPTYTRFGFDLVPFLEGLGYAVEIKESKETERRRYGAFDCLTFVTRKR